MKTLQNRANYFAQRLSAAMKGWGTDDDALVRIIVSRCEIDLATIKYEYEKIYGKTLLSDVKVIDIFLRRQVSQLFSFFCCIGRNIRRLSASSFGPHRRRLTLKTHANRFYSLIK